MLVADNLSDFRNKKTKQFALEAGDQIKIKDIPTVPKGYVVEITRARETESIELFIPLESWDEIPKVKDYQNLYHDEIFSFLLDETGQCSLRYIQEPTE
jgi:hypothetical protein